MHVVVLGAGVVGVTTAFYLAELGHSVTVVDQADGVASGASGGNGGQLSYSFTDPMANPALLTKLPKVMAGLDEALRFRPPVDSLVIRWGWAFLRQCSTHYFHQNMLTVLQLALRSSSFLSDIQSRIPLEFSFRPAGKLVMLDEPGALEVAKELCALKSRHGCETKVVTFEQAQEIEPALTQMNKRYAGAIYSADDHVGDARDFTSQLHQWLTNNTDTEFKFNTKIHRIVTKGDRFSMVETDKGTLKPDAVIVCLGAWSSHLFRPLGINTDIYPVRGYSVTLPCGEFSNSVSISDPGKKLVFGRIGEQIRIAGFADFIGFETHRDKERARKLLQVARNIAPDLADYDVDSISEWGGFRPMTPDSRPLVGPTKIKGLYLNTGHGMLGWTLACATGHDVAASV